MPEANALYSVTATVVVGLIAWVVVVLTRAKEPWSREREAPATTNDGTAAPKTEGLAKEGPSLASNAERQNPEVPALEGPEGEMPKASGPETKVDVAAEPPATAEDVSKA